MLTNNLNSGLTIKTTQQISINKIETPEEKIKEATSILNDFTSGTITEEETIARLQEKGFTPIKNIDNGETIIEVSINDQKFTGKYPIKISEPIVLTPKDQEVLDLTINDYITTSVKTSSNYTNLYRESALLNKYGFSEDEIQRYFEKRLGLYRLNTTSISKDFPGVSISTAEELKTLLECGINALKTQDNLESVFNSISNIETPKSEIINKIEDFINLLKKDLKEKNYAYDYINSILDFAIEKALNAINDKAIPQEIASVILNTINDIFGETNLVYMKQKGIGKNKTEANFFEDKDKMRATTLNNNLNKISQDGNIQAQYFTKMILDATSYLNLTEIEKDLFIQRIFDAVGKEIDNYEKGKTKLDFSSLSTLDKNKNGSWLDEFYEIVKKETSKINPNVDRNPSTIDAKELTNLLGRLSVEDFIEKLDDFLLSDDGGIRKFAQMIEEAFDKFGCQINGREELVACIFKLINEAGGCAYSDVLKSRAIKNLNQKDIFTTLEEIINSKRLLTMYELDYDGYIDSFKQGSTGDCWLLAGIISLNATSEGKKIIQNSLQLNDNDSVTVHFKGIGVSYTISREEILEAQTESEKFEGAYADGDNDVLILELATEKLRRDIAAGKVKIKENGVYNNSNSTEDDGTSGAGIEGGWIEQFVYFLTGKTADTRCIKDSETFSEDNIKNFYLKYYESFLDGNTALSFSVGGGTHYATTTNGEKIEVNIDTGHAFSIVDMTQDTVTIVNPWDSEKEYKLTWEEFAKFGINSMKAMPLV